MTTVSVYHPQRNIVILHNAHTYETYLHAVFPLIPTKIEICYLNILKSFYYFYAHIHIPTYMFMYKFCFLTTHFDTSGNSATQKKKTPLTITNNKKIKKIQTRNGDGHFGLQSC